MKYKKPLLILLILLLLAGLFGFYSYTKLQNEKERKLSQTLFGWKFPTVGFPNAGSGDVSQLAYSSIRDPGGIPRGLPVRLKIPSINVDTAIEDALITYDGRMDVPAGSINVAWFALGPYPGKVGSAVIGGHFGIDNGVPKVFYNLDKVKIGDTVKIVDDNGKTLSFIVKSTKSFNRDDDATTVFTSQDGLAHLNLITCEGIWNQVNDTYPQRLVVFTDAIPNQEIAEKIPALPATSETIATPTPRPPAQQLASPTALSTPTPEIIDPKPNESVTQATLTQDLLANIKILFSNPIDTGVTTSLLGSIALLVFKIIQS